MKKLRFMVVMIAILLTAVMVVTPVAAWGASVNVAAVDDESGSSASYVYSNNMGYLNYGDFPTQTFNTVQPGNINAATLANYDTLLLFACNPAVFSASQKADIVAFVNNGGKLIIWDSEDPYPGTWDYTWLPTPFASAVPGAMGATGKLFIDEENQLSSRFAADPFYIDNYTLSVGTDAVGDANVFTSYVPSQWCVDMTATNYLKLTGPTHVYTKNAGNGIIMVCGLDWDYAGYDYSTGDWLKKILQNELNAYYLPCSVSPGGSLIVDKVADKAVYAVGDTVRFDITVTNPTSWTVQNVGLVDYPPAEITLTSTTGSLGDFAPGETKTYTFRGTADAEGCDLENSVVATGYAGTQPVFSGGDTVTFDVGTNCGTPSPEFPTLALPVGMILGLAFVVYSLKPVRKN